MDNPFDHNQHWEIWLKSPVSYQNLIQQSVDDVHIWGEMLYVMQVSNLDSFPAVT